MEGAGNDYVYLDRRASSEMPLSQDQIALISDRHFGAGSDGVVQILPSEKADAFMRMWNSDGSESMMCGNALRCTAFYVAGELKKSEVLLETRTGLHRCRILDARKDESAVEGIAETAIAAPSFEAAKIPVIPERLGLSGEGPFFDIAAPGIPGPASLVSMGNPHLVVFVPEPDAVNIEETGRALENHPAFPARTNVEFVGILPDGTLKQRTWERGSGETLACGSGICAVLAAAFKTGRSPRTNTVHVRGGNLTADWKTDGVIYLTGPARIVYEGRITLKG